MMISIKSALYDPLFSLTIGSPYEHMLYDSMMLLIQLPLIVQCEGIQIRASRA